MNHYITWQKLSNGIYKRVSCSDDFMDTLSLFVEDGLETERYVSFLEDKKLQEFYSNISYLKKNGDNVTIFIDNDIFPDMIPYEMKTCNLIAFLNELHKLKKKGAENIRFSLQNDVMDVSSV